MVELEGVTGMLKSTITATFRTDIRQVWNVVTNNREYGWRSDLSRIEILDDQHFIEYGLNGFPTQFTITFMEECRRYEFDVENRNLTGRWTGIFSTTPEGGTKLEFTEELSVRNPVMALIARFFMPVKRIQQTYMEDLRKELGEADEI